MVISRLYIQNYRCFGETPAVINFSETGINAFVGSNNSGKSTALKAVEILLGDKWPVSQFSEDDFYLQQHDRTITIACELDESLHVPVSKGSRETIQIEGLLIEVKYLETGHGQSATEVTFQLLSGITDFASGNWEVACYGGRADRPMFISQDIRNRLPIAITIPLIKLNSEQPTNKWGVMGRMMQKVENAFNSDAEKKERFKGRISEAVGVLREPEEFIALETNVKNFWENVRPLNLSGTALEFLDYDPWHYYRQFRLAITKSGVDVPLDSLGEGVQRLAVIALYRAYLKEHSRSQKAILLIEEPESYLHPQGRSAVYKMLRNAVEGEDVEGQIIYTTHSSDFIDCAFFEEMSIFSETDLGSEIRQVNQEQMKAQTTALTGIAANQQIIPEIYFRLLEVDSRGLKDALFGSCAVIVEGSTDYEFLRFLVPVEEIQLAIVRAGGKDNIPAIYTFLSAFGIPTFICADRDNEAGRTSNVDLARLLNERVINKLSAQDILIESTDIDSLANGTKGVFRSLLIFATDLENFLTVNIPNYAELVVQLKNTFHIGQSKPKLMFAIGQSVQAVSVVTLTAGQAALFESIATEIKTFLEQKLPKPGLVPAE